MLKKALVFSSVMMALSCTSNASSLRIRSAGDLHCPAEDVKIYRLDERSFRVIGCNREAVYIDTCANDYGQNCAWLMNSDRDNLKRSGSAEPSTAGATAGGCSYDNQCKGDRVCVQHECVAPTAGAASP